MRIAKLNMDAQDKTRFEICGKSSVKYHLKANHVVEAKRWFWSLNNAIQFTKDEAREDEKRKAKDAESLLQARQEAGEKTRSGSDASNMVSSKAAGLAVPPVFPTGVSGGSRASGAASIRAESAFGDDTGSMYGSYEASLTAGDLSRVTTNAERAAHVLMMNRTRMTEAAPTFNLSIKMLSVLRRSRRSFSLISSPVCQKLWERRQVRTLIR